MAGSLRAGAFLRSLFAVPAIVVSLAASVQLEGTVYLRGGDNRIPLAGAFVAVRSAERGPFLVTVRTDSKGRYRIVNLRPQRLVVSASRPGYYTQLVGGRTGSEVPLDCSGGCSYAGIDFELIPGAVVSGVVLDRFGHPVERVSVSVAVRGRGGSKTTITDDRGRFRVAGLRPGDYVVRARFGRGSSGLTADPVQLELSAGEEHTGIRLSLAGLGAGSQTEDTARGSHSGFQVAGMVSGIGAGSEKRVRLRLNGISEQGQSYSARTDVSGRFTVEGVAVGRYAVTARSGRSRHSLGEVEVQGDIVGLVLVPAPTGSVAGKVQISADSPPAQVRLTFSSNQGSERRRVLVRAPRFEFQLPDLEPGSYRIVTTSRDVYVKGISQGDEIISADDVTISAGANRLEIVVAAEHGRVYGTIHEPGSGQPLPLARVALDGPKGMRPLQADQNGRFSFDRVVPGEYRICAWTDIDPNLISEEASWEAAGCEEKVIPVAPDSKVEIDLTATP